MFLHQNEEVAYVDAQRNVAVTFGERDVKKDVRAKNKWELNKITPSPQTLYHSRKERTVMSDLTEGNNPEAFLAQVTLVGKENVL